MNEFHFTPLDPSDLAKKMAEIVLQQLEPRLQALEKEIRENAAAEYLPLSEVQRRFNIGKDLLRKLVEVGMVQRYDTDGHGRYKASEIEEYLSRYHTNRRRKRKPD